jgi:muconate cycloisomerase
VGTAGAGGQHVFVRIETTGGHVGWGEVRALPAWSYETVESITFAVRNYLAPLVLGRSPFELNAVRRLMDDTLIPAVSNGQPFAKAALDIALHDLQGQLTGQPLHALLGGKVRDTVPLTYALSIAPADVMAAQAGEYAEATCFKIKVAGDPEADRDRVRAVSEARPDAMLWLDANQAYSPARLVPFLEAVRGVPRLFCLEQPVRSPDWLGLRAARERSPLPIAVDEGCFSSYDVARLAELRAAELLVLKVCKSGGLRECLKSAAVAEAHGIGLLGSGLTESGVGFAASIHFFAAVDTLLPPELNGVQFLETMAVEGLRIEGTIVHVPDGPGLGVRVDEDTLRRHVIAL